MPRQYSRACAQCGAGFPITHPKSARRFCSKACFGASRRQQVACTCLRCGKAFTVKVSHAAIGEGKFCSRACAFADPGRNERARRPNRSLVRSCPVCGTPFRATAADLAKGHGRYCSRECFARSITTGQWLPCRACGQPIWNFPGTPRKYCSQACYWQALRDLENEGRQCARYRQWRATVLERDRHTCQHCGLRGGLLHVHHIKPFATFRSLRTEVTNGLTLCPSCHWDTHYPDDPMPQGSKVWGT